MTKEPASTLFVVVKEAAVTAPEASILPLVLKEPAITFTVFKVPPLRVVVLSLLNKPLSSL